MIKLSKLTLISCGIILLFSTSLLAQKHTKTNQNVDSLFKIATAKDDTNAVNARISLYLKNEIKNPYEAKLHLDKASELTALTNYTKGIVTGNPMTTVRTLTDIHKTDISL